ncbi:MAG: hypothetical protein AAGF11_12180, partial [Myxococcota bacterium]
TRNVLEAVRATGRVVPVVGTRLETLIEGESRFLSDRDVTLPLVEQGDVVADSDVSVAEDDLYD